MSLLQQINNLVTNQIQIFESGDTLVANLRAIIDDNNDMSEDRAHTVAKVIVMWNIIKQNSGALQTALTYDMVCTILQRVLTNSVDHASLSSDMITIASRVYGNPKNIVKMQKYIAKVSQQVDTKIAYKVKAMSIASQLIHKQTDSKIKQQLLQLV